MRASRRPRRVSAIGAVLALAPLLAGCDGPQSALVTAGRGAAQVATLFWVMTIGSVIIWLVVVALALYAYWAGRTIGERAARRLVVIGGVAVPIALLTALLAGGLSMMPGLLPSGQRADVQIEITGYQYWWRVRYVGDRVPAVELANELHLPAGRRVELLLQSRDVIHSFWVPSLAGKVDLIPGRTTRLVLEPMAPGVYRGTCAEYCGASHAWMGFHVIVEEPARFEAWLDAQAAPAVSPADLRAANGAAQFLANGCGACHAIRGTAANGVIGPDLTHVGSRHALAAGALPNDVPAHRRWIVHTSAVKPGVQMPAFGMLSADAVEELALYLEGLQ